MLRRRLHVTSTNESDSLESSMGKGKRRSGQHGNSPRASMNEDELDNMDAAAPKSPARAPAPAQAVASPAQLSAEDEGSPVAAEQSVTASEPAADAEPAAAAPAPVVPPPKPEPTAERVVTPPPVSVDIPVSPGAERFINTMSNVGGNLSELGATDVSDGMLELSRRCDCVTNPHAGRWRAPRGLCAHASAPVARLTGRRAR